MIKYSKIHNNPTVRASLHVSLMQCQRICQDVYRFCVIVTIDRGVDSELKDME